MLYNQRRILAWMRKYSRVEDEETSLSAFVVYITLWAKKTNDDVMSERGDWFFGFSLDYSYAKREREREKIVSTSGCSASSWRWRKHRALIRYHDDVGIPLYHRHHLSRRQPHRYREFPRKFQLKAPSSTNRMANQTRKFAYKPSTRNRMEIIQIIIMVGGISMMAHTLSTTNKLCRKLRHGWKSAVKIYFSNETHPKLREIVRARVYLTLWEPK